MGKEELCFQCNSKGSDFFGFTICNSCKSRLGLFTDKTIQRYIKEYQAPLKKHSFEEEINKRLSILENDYIKKRLKLLYIKDRIKQIKSETEK